MAESFHTNFLFHHLVSPDEGFLVEILLLFILP